MTRLREVIRRLSAYPLAADVALAAAVLTVAIIAGLTAEPFAGQRTIGGLGWVLIIATNAPLALRRRRPVLAMWAVVAANVPFWILDYPDEPVRGAFLVAVYSVGAHVDHPRSLRHAVAASTIVIGMGVVGVLAPTEDLPWFAIPAFIVMYGTAWILGDNLRTRRAYLDELERAATHDAAHREAEAKRAVFEERTRIARELHDVVAHSMSVMVVQAGAARRVLDDNPAQAAQALAAIEATGRESLNEMRRLLGVLRNDTDDAELAPAPTLDDLDRLVEQCGQAGLDVDIVTEGDRISLPSSLDVNAYRVVQESLTNTLKHAGPARATVTLRFTPNLLAISVVDDGHGSAADPPAGSGQGIIGMRERIETSGGTITTGPKPGGGFAVHAALPLEPST